MARKAIIARTILCFSGSGKNRSITSMALPKSMSWTAWRCRSSCASANISSRERGGVRTSNRPSAREGASAHIISSPMPAMASAPCFSDMCSSICTGSL